MDAAAAMLLVWLRAENSYYLHEHEPIMNIHKRIALQNRKPNVCYELKLPQAKPKSVLIELECFQNEAITIQTFSCVENLKERYDMSHFISLSHDSSCHQVFPRQIIIHHILPQ